MTILHKTFLAAVVVLTPALAAADTCPSFANSGAELTLSSDDVWVPQSTDLIAGGDLDLSACADVPGYGHVIENPDFTLQYDALTHGRALEFRVVGECDTVLLINSAIGEWHFNDDDDELNPRINLADAPSGQYDIWVGTLGEEYCGAALEIESF